MIVALVLVIGLVVWGAAQARGPHRTTGERHHDEAERALGLASQLGRRTDAGLVSEAQAAAIVAWERDRKASRAAPPGAASRIPIVAEALGYLSGALGIAGLGLIVARYWPDTPTVARVALSVVAALALLGAGALVREQVDPALARLRWFL